MSNIWIFVFTYLFILDINTPCTFSASLFQIKNIWASQLQRWKSPSKVSVVIRKHSRAWLYCWMMQTENHNFIKIIYTIPQMALILAPSPCISSVIPLFPPFSSSLFPSSTRALSIHNSILFSFPREISPPHPQSLTLYLNSVVLWTVVWLSLT